MEFSCKLFLEDEGRFVFGPGRANLLRSIERLGSLHKAAQHLGMSYRRAWGRIKNLEQALDVELLRNEPGMGNAKGLTDDARELLAWYTEYESRIAAVLEAAEASCPAFLRARCPVPDGESGAKPGRKPGGGPDPA